MSVDRGRRVAGGAVCVLLPLLAGCYEFDRPLGPPAKGTIDRALLGAWRCRDEKHGDLDHGLIRFLPFDGTQYLALVATTQGGQPRSEQYRLYSTRIGTHALLNVQGLESKGPSRSWALARYRVEGSSLSLWLVDDEAVGGSGAPALRAVRTRVADETIYSLLLTCTREEETR